MNSTIRIGYELPQDPLRDAKTDSNLHGLLLIVNQGIYAFSRCPSNWGKVSMAPNSVCSVSNRDVLPQPAARGRPKARNRPSRGPKRRKCLAPRPKRRRSIPGKLQARGPSARPPCAGLLGLKRTSGTLGRGGRLDQEGVPKLEEERCMTFHEPQKTTVPKTSGR